MKSSILLDEYDVRDILSGRKTQMRIPCEIFINGNQHVDHKYAIDVSFPETNISGPCANFYGDDQPFDGGSLTGRQLYYIGSAQQPFNVGGVIYGRETVGYGYYAAWDNKVYYKADYTDPDVKPDFVARWVPAAAMPKEDARLFLRITDIGVQRLQDISFEDCKREGIWDDYKALTPEIHDLMLPVAYRRCFRDCWNDSLSNKKKTEYGWEQNPWVWVVSFERIKKEDV